MTDPLNAEGIVAAIHAYEEPDMWQNISTAPTGEELFLAYCPPDFDFRDGRMMIVRGSILVSMLNPKTPRHLQFPATHWRPLPTPPTIGADDDARTS